MPGAALGQVQVIGLMGRSREGQPGAFFELGHGELVDPELIQGHEHLQPVQILGEQEGSGFELSVLCEEDELPVFDGDLVAPVVLVLGEEDGAGEDAAPQVIEVHILIERIFQPSPDARLAGLVEVIHLRGDVREVERILVRLMCFGGCSPGVVGAAGEVSTVEPVVRIQVITGLVFLGDAGVFGEVQPGAGEQLHGGAVDGPADPVRELAGAAEDQGEMRVIEMTADPSTITESVCCSTFRTGGSIGAPRNDVSNPKAEVGALSVFIPDTPALLDE